MNVAEKSILTAVFVALAGLSIWLQSGLLEPERTQLAEPADNEPDYYIEKFTATGIDTAGRRYVVEADRMVHFPVDDTALLDNPHVIQYEENVPPRHVYADSGWMSSNGEEILMTGSVRVIQGKGNLATGGITTTDKMKIRLRQKEG